MTSFTKFQKDLRKIINNIDKLNNSQLIKLTNEVESFLFKMKPIEDGRFMSDRQIWTQNKLIELQFEKMKRGL